MKCIDCGKEIDSPAKCGLNVCEECCITCYKQDDPCKDMPYLVYCRNRNRAILRDYKAGVDMAVIEHKYGVRKETIARIRRQKKE